MGSKATMKVWDVDHGLAIWLRTPNSKDIVIDLGAGSYGKDKNFSPLRYMKDYGLGSIECLIITHPHADHLDDIMNLKNLGIAVHTFTRPSGLDKATLEKGMDEARKAKLSRFFEMNVAYNSPVPANLKCDTESNWGGLTFKVHAPPVGKSETNINNCSLVTVIKFADLKIVIPGDNEPPSWTALRTIPEFESDIKNADILIAPHHGRESGYDEETVKLINPRLTIISDKSSETTASDKYSNASRGWTVYKSDDTNEQRKCLTTRKDGRVQVEFGYGDSQKAFLHVSLVS